MVSPMAVPSRWCQQLEAVLCVGAQRGVERVVGEAGDDGHPALETDDLDHRCGDADAGDPAAQGAAGEAAEPDAGGGHQRGADDEDAEPGP